MWQTSEERCQMFKYLTKMAETNKHTVDVIGETTNKHTIKWWYHLWVFYILKSPKNGYMCT